MKMAVRLGTAAVLMLAMLALPTLASAQDHPLIGHLEGASPAGFSVSEFDETNIIIGLIAYQMPFTQRGEGWKTVEGKVYHIYHRLPDGLTNLAAQRSYEKHLKSKGFNIAFTCNTEAGTCFTNGRGEPGLALGLALDGTVDMPRLETPDLIRNLFYKGTGRYLLATMDRPEGTMYVSAAFSDSEATGRFVIAKIIETGELQHTGFALTKASDLESKLNAEGKVDIYGIQFDFDRADIKPESRPQLEAISTVLTENPELRLNVIGHTDNQGSEAYNANLSERRAKAVVSALVADFGIDAARLAPVGKGFSAPLASNDTDEGRAKNRRVELAKP